MKTVVPRSLAERQSAARDLLAGHNQLWLTTGSDGHGGHMIPVSYVWDGEALTMATFARSRTAANLRANPRARVAVGETEDLVMIDGEVTLVDVADIDEPTADAFARVSVDPRATPGFVYLRLRPTRMQVWNSYAEYQGRTVMREARWL